MFKDTKTNMDKNWLVKVLGTFMLTSRWMGLQVKYMVMKVIFFAKRLRYVRIN